MKNIIVISILILLSFTCVLAQSDTAVTRLGVASSSWKKIDFASNKTVKGWFTNDATSAADSIFCAFGITGRIDTAQGQRTVIKAGEVLEIQPRLIRYFYFKRAGSSDCNVRGVFTK